jgi:hypothetical protein
VFGSGLVIYALSLFDRERLGLRDTFSATVLLLMLPVSTSFLIRGLVRGERAVRWLLFAVLLLSGVFYLYLAGKVAMPLPPAKQAQWERDYWWIIPLTYTWGGMCLGAATLLLLPHVGAYLTYRRGQMVVPFAAPDPAAR